jgi:PAS domain S-box-containing protein/putative nucleotidyltransferase with HDIG domain
MAPIPEARYPMGRRGWCVIMSKAEGAEGRPPFRMVRPRAAGASRGSRRSPSRGLGGLDPVILDQVPDGICIAGADDRIRQANVAFTRILRRPLSEIIGRTHLELFHHLIGEEADCPVARMERTRQRQNGRVPFGHHWYHVTANPLFDNRGRPAGAIHIFSDVTTLQQAEKALLGTNRVFMILYLCDQVLVRSDDESSLLRNVCRIVVEKGGFRLAWIGLVDGDGNGDLREAARAETEAAFGEDPGVAAGDHEDLGGLARKALETRKPVVIRSLFASGGGDAEGANGSPAASIVLPLVANGLALGAMAVSANEADAFAEQDVLMLTDLADDLAYGIEAIRTRRRLECAVLDLRVSEEKYETLVERSHDGIIVAQNGQLVFVNSRVAEMVGLRAEELMGTSITDYVAQEHVALVAERYRARLAGESPASSYEVDLLVRGGRLPVELSSSVIVFRGEPAVMAFIRDISDRRAAAKKLQDSEERYRTTLDGMLEGCQIIGHDWRYLYVNDAACAHGGKTREELLGRTIMEAYPGIERTRLFSRMRACMEEGVAARFENEFARPDGGTAWLELSMQPVPEGIFILSMDISERKDSERELSIANRFLESANQCTDAASLLRRFVDEIRELSGCEAVGIRMIDQAGNMPYRIFTGFSKEFFESESPLSIMAGSCMCANVIRGTIDPAEPFFTRFGSYLQNRMGRFLGTATEDFKKAARGACSAAGFESVALIPLRANGRILGLVHLADRRENMVPPKTVHLLERTSSALGSGILRAQAEESLRRSEEKYRSLFESTNEAMVLFEIVRDEAGQAVDFEVLDVNPVYEALTGTKKADRVGRRILDVPSPAVDIEVLRRVASGGAPETRETENPALGRSLRFSVFSMDSTRVAAIFSDVTERKKKDQELLESEHRLREAYLRLRDVQEGTIGAIATMAELRDPYTSGHQRRVARVACAIAEEMDLAEDRISGLATAGLLHDIGKIQIPSDILSKPGRLTPIELGMIRSHAQAGYQILRAIPFPWPVADIIIQHHERMDGSGYPAGLAGEQILLEARILGVADVLEAMASHRPYRAALGIEAALEEITKQSGRLYDPEVAAACQRLFARGFKLDEDPA